VKLLHPFNSLFPGQSGWAGTRKVNHSGFYWSERWWGSSGISWTICKSSAPRTRQITTPVPHHSVLQAKCPSCCPTNSVKALKAKTKMYDNFNPDDHVFYNQPWHSLWSPYGIWQTIIFLRVVSFSSMFLSFFRLLISAKLCGVEHRAPPIFGRAAITLGTGPHSSSLIDSVDSGFTNSGRCSTNEWGRGGGFYYLSLTVGCLLWVSYKVLWECTGT